MWVNTNPWVHQTTFNDKLLIFPNNILLPLTTLLIVGDGGNSSFCGCGGDGIDLFAEWWCRHDYIRKTNVYNIEKKNGTRYQQISRLSSLLFNIHRDFYYLVGDGGRKIFYYQQKALFSGVSRKREFWAIRTIVQYLGYCEYCTW